MPATVRASGRRENRRVDEEEARDRFARARVATLGTVTADLRPHVVPCTFALVGAFSGTLIGTAVVTAVDDKPKRTRRLQRLANIAANPHVALLAHSYADDWSALWWVRADGEAVVLHDGDRHEAAVGALVAKYVQYAERAPSGPVIWVDVRRWSGWTAAGT
jgi:PPOX class probable F420-dependent enzyme